VNFLNKIDLNDFCLIQVKDNAQRPGTERRAWTVDIFFDKIFSSKS